MSVLLNLMIKIVLMVGLGWGLKKRKVINDELQKGISNLLMTAVLPFNIIASSCQELTKESLYGTIFVAVFSIIYYIGTLLVMTVMSRHLRLTDKCKKLMITMAVFANTGFIGFPLVEELFGASALIYAVIYNMFYQVFFYTYGMYLLSSDGKVSVADIFRAPVTIASFLALVVFLGQIPIPEVILDTCSTVGAMTVPLSMIVIGCTLADMKLVEVMKDKYGYLISGLRLVAFPMVALVMLKALGVSGTVAGICVLITGLPSGSLNVIVAQQQESEPDFAARAVVQSMVYMVVSLPVLVWVMECFFRVT